MKFVDKISVKNDTYEIHDTAARNLITETGNQVGELQGDVQLLDAQMDLANSGIKSLKDKVTTIENKQVTDEANIYQNTTDIANLKPRVSEVEAVSTQNQADIVNIKSRLTTAENTLTTVNDSIDVINAINNQQTNQININKKDIAGLKTRMSAAEDDIADIRTDIDDLDERITASTYEAGKGIYFGQGEEHTNINVEDELIDKINEVDGLDERVTAAEKNIKTINNDITDIKGDITDIQGDITNINSNISTINNNITRINGDITDIKGDITDIKGDISTINNNITTINGDITDVKGDITNINNNITTINGDIADVKGDITDVKGDITDIKGDITKLQGDVSDIQSDMGGIQTDLTTAQGDIKALQGDVTNIKSDIGDLQTDMTTAQGDITALQGDVSSIQSDIGDLQTDMTTAQGDITALQGDVSNINAFISPIQLDFSYISQIPLVINNNNTATQIRAAINDYNNGKKVLARFYENDTQYTWSECHEILRRGDQYQLYFWFVFDMVYNVQVKITANDTITVTAEQSSNYKPISITKSGSTYTMRNADRNNLYQRIGLLSYDTTTNIMIFINDTDTIGGICIAQATAFKGTYGYGCEVPYINVSYNYVTQKKLVITVDASSYTIREVDNSVNGIASLGANYSHMGVINTRLTDANNAVPGLYMFETSTGTYTNYPPDLPITTNPSMYLSLTHNCVGAYDSTVLHNVPTANGYAEQILTELSHPDVVYRRYRNNSGIWTSWYKFTGTVVT